MVHFELADGDEEGDEEAVKHSEVSDTSTDGLLDWYDGKTIGVLPQGVGDGEAMESPSRSVRQHNAEVFNKVEQVAAARRLASDVVTATVDTKGQFVPGELEMQGALNDIKLQKAFAVLQGLLDALASHGDDEEFTKTISKEALKWVKMCKKLGVDPSGFYECIPEPSRGAAPSASST